MDLMALPPLDVQAMRTELGRPRSSMRLRTWTATCPYSSTACLTAMKFDD